MAVARLNEELRVAKRERDAEVGTGASAAPAGSEMSARDEQAVRRMYEDLTGFIVSGVEMHDRRRGLRRFKMVFTSAGYFGASNASVRYGADVVRPAV